MHPPAPRLAAHPASWLLLLATAAAALAACGDDASSGATPAGGGGAGATASAGSGGSAGQAAGGGGGAATEPAPLASCSYTNNFSKGRECRVYTGPAWTLEDAADDCKKRVFGAPGVLAEGVGCAFAAALGTCEVPEDDGYGYSFVSEGADAATCAATQNACQTFAKGTFTPGNTCAGAGGSGGGSSSGDGAFVQPYQTCQAPLPGEPAGKGPDGQVCTWTLISGATEEGRRFQDYASCDDVRTQRPYYSSPTAGQTPAGDARLNDAAYLAEVAWAASQVQATACVCCHDGRAAPDGTSQWRIDTGGVWLDTISDSGLAMMAGLADSSAFGAFPPAENNGFDREALGVPTNDVPRMRALLLSEWARRGFTEAEGKAYPPFGGPLVDQRDFVPAPCAEGEGIDENGVVSWGADPARYVYVLDVGSKNPGVPPNLDLPAGTRWHVAVPTTGEPVLSGILYGEAKGGLLQRVPEAGTAAPALVKGQNYVLVVLQDIAFPAARCVFTAN